MNHEDVNVADILVKEASPERTKKVTDLEAKHVDCEVGGIMCIVGRNHEHYAKHGTCGC